MKKSHIKHFFAAFSSVLLLITACACSNTKLKTAEPTTKVILTTETTKTTVPTTPDETTTEARDKDTSSSSKIDIGSVMGLDNCYCERDDKGAPFYIWTFRSGDGRAIGVQFGYGVEEKPLYYIDDMDKDGTDELICDCEFGADGAHRTFIYRNNNGVIEQGSVDLKIMEEKTGAILDTPSFGTHYDPEKGTVIFTHRANDISNDYELTMSDYEFSEYVPEG